MTNNNSCLGHLDSHLRKTKRLESHLINPNKIQIGWIYKYKTKIKYFYNLGIGGEWESFSNQDTKLRSLKKNFDN